MFVCLKIFIIKWEKSSVNFFFLFFAVPRGLWDPSFLTRDQTQAPCSESVES